MNAFSVENPHDGKTFENYTRFEWGVEVGVVTTFMLRLFVPHEFDMMTLIVEFQRASSDAESLCVGVPQGSILGPLLFAVHVNGLPITARKCSTLRYADDTVLFYSGKVAATIEKSLNEDLDQMDPGSVITAYF